MWTLINNDTVNTPGYRLMHQMIADYEMKFIYLFGGITVDTLTGNTYKNDLWKYYILEQKWELVVPFGVSTASRRVNLWNGIFENVPVSTDQLLSTDVITYVAYNSSDPTQ